MSTRNSSLFSGTTLLIIGAVSMLVSLSLFPWQKAGSLESKSATEIKEQFSSPLKAQLHQMLDQPHAPASDVLSLADTLAKKGLWKKSQRLLREKLALAELSEAQNKHLAVVQLRNYLSAYYVSDSSNEVEAINVKRHLQHLDDYENLGEKELVALAKVSVDFRLLPQAIKIYKRLATLQPERAAYWMATASKWYVEAGDYVSAADALKKAGNLSNNHRYTQAYVYAWLSVASKAGLKEEVREFLQSRQYKLPKSQQALEGLAKASLEVGMPAMASNLYGHLSVNDKGPKSLKWLEKAAHWATEAGQYPLAENYLSSAYQKAGSDSEKWMLDQRMIEVYVKSGQPGKALERIEPLIMRHSDNAKLLEKGIELAFLEKDAALARRWNRHFLDKNPKDVKAIMVQADIETWDENITAAIGLIKKAVRLEPKNIKLRERWAYLEESNGNPSLASDIWQQLYQRGGLEKHQQHVIRIAESNLGRGGLKTLLTMANAQSLPQQAINDVYFFLRDKRKDVEAAGLFLKNYVGKHGASRDTQVLLARWHADQKQYDKALELWATIEGEHGQNKQSRLARLELLWAAGRKQDAMRLWQRSALGDKKLTRSQLEIVAEMAWVSEDFGGALKRYKALLKGGKKTAFYQHRIALSLAKLGRHQAAMKAFKSAYISTGDADVLLDGLQLSFDSNDSRTFASLVELASERKGAIEAAPRFWILRAAMELKQQRLDAASDYYQHALSLSPGLTEAVEGLEQIRVARSGVHKQAIQKQLQAMQAAFDQGDFKALARYMAEAENNKQAFTNLPQYWLLRGGLHAQQKRHDLVFEDYLALLRIDPSNVAGIKGVLLALRSSGNTSHLQSALIRWNSVAVQSPELWLDYAISWQLLDQHQRSLGWFKQAHERQPRDASIMINYANSLEKLGRSDLAAGLRQKSMYILRQQLAGGFSGDKQVEAGLQYLGLLHKNKAVADFDAMFAHLSAEKLSLENRKRLYQIGLAFALDQNDLARLGALLRLPGVRAMEKPLWMRLSIALKLKDRRELKNILSRHSGQIKLGDRVAALIELKREQQAFELAKKGIKTGKTSKERKLAYQLARSLADGRVSEVAATLNRLSVAGLSVDERRLQYKHGAGKSGLPAGFDILFKQAELRGSEQMIDERDLSIGFDWKLTAGQLKGRLGLYDNGKQQKLHGNLAYTQKLNEKLTGRLEAGFQETPEESPFLRINGRRNRVSGELTGRIDENNTAQLAIWKNEFKSIENENKLASGVGARGSLVHRQTSGDLQWFGGVQATVQRNKNTESLSAGNALSESAASLNLIAGINRGTPGQGLPIDDNLQYSGNIAVGKNWPNDDYTVRAEAAVGKSLWKDDELSVSAFYDQNSGGDSQNKGVMIKYRKFLDFPTSKK